MANTIKGLLPSGKAPTVLKAEIIELIKTEAPATDLTPYATKEELAGISSIQEVSGQVSLEHGGPAIREFYTKDSTTFSSNGEKTVVPGGEAVVWMRDGRGIWGYKIVDQWIVPTLAPDTTAPSSGTLTVAVKSATSLELRVTGASDNRGLHATPYAFSLDGGASWSDWQQSASYTATGLTTEQAYRTLAKVRDTAGLESYTSVVVAAPTGAEPVMNTLMLADTFNRPDGRLVGTSSDTGQVWEGALNGMISGGKMRLPGGSPVSINHSVQGDAALFAFDVILPASRVSEADFSIPMQGAVTKFRVARDSTRSYITAMENLTAIFNNGNGDLNRNPWAFIPGADYSKEMVVRVKVYLQDGGLSIYADGRRILAYTLRTTGALAGTLQIAGNAAIMLDNLEVKKP